MSVVIGSKVLHLGFDNAEFRSGVEKSIKDISHLNNSLRLDGVAKSVDSLSSTFNKFSLNNLGGSIANLTDGLSIMEIAGVTALSKIMDSAIALGTQLIKSLTIDPIALGMADYDRKLTSIQTITNAVGKDVGYVQGYFNQLDEYADKTIYNLDHMTGALAKFVNAGVDLDAAVPAIKGISNMTALAGQDANAAGIAYYNLSQSIAGGYLTTMDFRSLNLANVATKEWKQHMADAAVAAGTIKEVVGKDGSKMYNVAGVKEAVNLQGLFNTTLSEGWATTDILMKVLGDYGDTTTEIGKKAQSAAQDVKSWGMMMETLKASVGTGWTDTFQLIIGDLDQAKALYSPLTATIQGLMDAMTDARNNMLKVWADLGGRTSLIEAFVNLYRSVVAVLEPVQKAFAEIFPPFTGEKLFELTEGFKTFAKELIPTEETIAKIQRIFRGVFSIVDIFLVVITEVKDELMVVFNLVKPYGKDILEFLAVLGDSASEWRNQIRQYGFLQSFFNKVHEFAITIKGLAVAFQAFMKTSKVAGVVFGIQSAFMALIAYIKGSDLDAAGDFIAKLVERFSPLFKLAAAIGGVISKIWNALEPLRNIIDKLKGVAMHLASNLFDTIINALNSIDFAKINYSAIFDGLNTALTAGFMLSVTGLFNKGTGMFGKTEKVIGVFEGLSGKLEGILQSVSGVLDGVRGSLEAWQQNLRAGILGKIAGAVALLAFSLIALAMVDSAKLTLALGAITALFAELFGVMAGYEKLAGVSGGMSLTKAVAGMMGLAIAMVFLSGSLIILSKIEPEELNKSLKAITVLVGLLLVAAKMLNRNSAGMVKASIGLIAFSFAVRAMIKPVKELGAIDQDELAKGLIGLGVLLAELSVFMRLTDFSKMSLKNAAGLLVFTLSVGIMSVAVERFAKMNDGEVTKGLLVLALILTEMTAFTKLTSGSTNMITTAISMAILGGAILLFTEGLKVLGTMSWESLAKGLLGIAGALGIVILALKFMPKDILVSSLGLLAVAGALVILSNALVTMGSMTWEEVARGLVLLSGSMLVIAIGLNAMTNALPGAAALIVAALALAILAPPLKLLGSMPLASIGIALLALVGVFVVLGVASYVLAPLVPVLFALGGAMALLGVAALAVGLGLLLFSSALAALAVTGVAGATALVAIVGVLASSIPLVAMAIGTGIVALAGVIKDGAPIIFDAASAMILGFIRATAENIPAMVDALLTFVDTFLRKIAEKLPSIVRSGFDIVIGFLSGIRDNIGELVSVASEMIMAFVNAYAEKLPELIQTGFNFIVAFIDGLALAVETNMPRLMESVARLTSAVIKGFQEGMFAGYGVIWNTMLEMGKTAIDAIKNALGIKSPSTEFKMVGEFIIDGLLQGIENSWTNITTAITNFSSQMVETFNRVIPSILLFGMRLITSLRSGIDSTKNRVLDTIYGLINSILNAVNSKMSKFFYAGQQIVQGLIDGINDLIWDAVNIAYNLASSVMNTINDALNIRSPSGETYKSGKYTVMGFANALLDYAYLIDKASDLIADSVSTKFADARSKLVDSLASNMSFGPVLTPVLDLSKVEKSAKQISGLIPNRSIELSATTATVFKESQRKTRHTESDSETENQTQRPEQAVTYVQNNYSPKPLDPLEIYRKTRFQLYGLRSA